MRMVMANLIHKYTAVLTMATAAYNCKTIFI